MAFKTSDGKHKSSKFRASRYDREHEEKPEEKPEEKDGGNRAMANKMEAKNPGNPETEMGEEQAEEMVHPGIHDEIKGIVSEHGPAHTVNTTHDHEGMRSHVHSIHADGHEHHADHEGDEHVKHAHEHHGHAAGLPMPEEQPEHEENPGGEEEYGEPL